MTTLRAAIAPHLYRVRVEAERAQGEGRQESQQRADGRAADDAEARADAEVASELRPLLGRRSDREVGLLHSLLTA